MNDQTDQQLLQDYAEHRSEPAFAELVSRHVDLVHSAAMRMVCDSHLAKDVTQAAFVALAQNARQLKDRPVLSGWLHRTAQNLASKTVRTDVRRRASEQEAAAVHELLSAGSDVSWEHVAQHLDAALGELSEPDRDAVLLRYFEKKSAQEMAERLGISDEAAQKRVSRAVERLREFFAKRGITVGASGLAVVISANAVQAAPVGLAITISTAAALTGTTLATTATVTATKSIAMTTLQKTLITVTVAVLAGTGIYEARQASNLRSQTRTLQQEQAPLAKQIQELQRERDEATNQLARVRAVNERLDPNTSEVLRLRAEVGKLQARTRELEVQAGEHSVGDAGKQREKIVVVVGEVNAPGPKAWADSMKLTDALSMAKGTTSFAAKKVSIKGAGGNSNEYNLDEVAGGQAEDPLLKPGEIVYVPRSGVPSTPADSGSAAK